MTKPDARTCVRSSKPPGSSSAANAVSHGVGYLAAQFYDNAEPGEAKRWAHSRRPWWGFRPPGDHSYGSPVALAHRCNRHRLQSNSAHKSPPVPLEVPHTAPRKRIERAGPMHRGGVKTCAE